MTGFQFSDCECPNACQVKEYAAELSYAALSTLSVNSLLHLKTSDLRFKYHHALEIQQAGGQNTNGKTRIIKLSIMTMVHT